MPQTIQNTIAKLITIGIILTVFIPFIRGYLIFFPQGFGKAVIFKIIIEILTALYLVLIILNKDYLPWRIFNGAKKLGLIEWSVLGFLTATVIAGFLSVDRHLAFWGELERAGGLFALFHYIALFFLALIFLNDNTWRRVWFAAIFASVLMAAIAIEQKFNFFNLYFLNYYERPSSVIGNPNFLAAYLLLLVFPTFSFALQKFNVWRFNLQTLSAVGYLFAAGLQAFAVLITASRGAFLGLVGGISAFLLLYPAKSSRLKFVTVALIVFAAISFYLLKTYPDSPLLSKDSIVQRLSSISVSEHTTKTRLLAWQISWEAFREKPIFGWGPENFSIGFDAHFKPGLEQFGKTETWFDRAHNFIFDVGVTSGIVGLAAYLAIFAAIFYLISQKKKNVIARRSPQATDEAISRGLPRSPYGSLAMTNGELFLLTGLQSAWVAFLIQNLFNFDTVSVYIISFLLLAYTVYLVQPRAGLEVRLPDALGSRTSKLYAFAALKTIGAVLILFFFSKLIFFANLRPLWTNYEVNRLVDLIKTGYPEQALAQFDALSKTKTPYDHSFYFLKQSPWEFTYAKTLKDVDPKKSAEIVRKTIERVKKYGQLRPHYTRNYLFLADLYDFLIQQGYPEFQAEKDEALRKVKELSPDRMVK